MINNSINKIMIDKVKNTIEKYNMPVQSSNILVGVSGGADSVCLLHVLCSIAKEYNFTVYSAHINHMLREEADEDQKFVEELAYKLGVKHFTFTADIPTISQYEKISDELAGRQARYKFLKDKALEIGNCKIAVAHNKNDQAETVLLHLIRGAGLKGLTGMEPVYGDIIRPLLYVSREEIEEYLSSNNLAFIEDKTNFLPIYTRNKIRLEIIPKILELNPNFINAVTRTSDLLKEDNRFIESYARECFEKHAIVSANNQEVIIPLEFIVESSIGGRIILLSAEALTGSRTNIELVHINRVMLLAKKHINGKKADIVGNLKAKIEHGKLIIYLNNQAEP